MKSLINRTLLLFTLVLASSLSWAGALTNYAENKIVDALLRGQSLGAPATFYVGLDTVACDDAGGGTEVTGGSYARVAVTSSLANWAGTQSAGSTSASSGSGGTTSNNNAVSFSPNPTAGWGTAVSLRFWDASTSGNAWICIALSSSQTINIGNTVSWPAGTLTLQIDN